MEAIRLSTVHGKPTALDVERLREAFGVPAAGVVITHEQIEAVLECSHRTPRYRSVLKRWRDKLERESDGRVWLHSEINVGYVSADPHRKVTQISSDVKSGIRKVVRAGNRATKTDRANLSDEQCKTLDHTIQIRAKFQLADATEQKSINFMQPLQEQAKKRSHKRKDAGTKN